MWGSRRIVGPWTCNPKAEGNLCCSLPFSQQFPSCIYYWRVIKPYRAKGVMGGRHVPKPVSWGRRQGSPQEDGRMAPSLPAMLSGTCLLDWSRFLTLLHFPASCPAYSSFFMSQGWWPVPPSVGAQHQLLRCCIPCRALLGESGSEAQSLCSSPPLTTVSPLTHDWQQQEVETGQLATSQPRGWHGSTGKGLLRGWQRRA